MGKEKKYASIRALLGAGTVCGIGLVPAWWMTNLMERAGDDSLFLFSGMALCLLPSLAMISVHEEMDAAYILGPLLGLCLFCGFLWGDIRVFRVLFYDLFWAPIGCIPGWFLGQSIGRKADERAHAELARRKQEREQVEQKKAEIIAKIDEELGEQNGNVS